MFSRRYALVCVALCVVVGLSRDVVAAPSPQTANPAAAPAAQSDPRGPLERRAGDATPANPIPLLTTSRPAENPISSEPLVIVALRVVVDQEGRVGEARALMMTRGRGAVLEPATDPFVESAIRAVLKWRYEKPISPPLAFNVVLEFSKGQQGRLVTPAPGTTPPSGVVGGVLAGLPFAPPPPPPPPESPVKVGGSIPLPPKVKHVSPVYPAIAQSANVQGVVVLEAVIGTDGHVSNARVLRSIPLLDQAAIDAVRQWEFSPTLVGGTPVPVTMTVTVQFSLSESKKPDAGESNQK